MPKTPEEKTLKEKTPEELEKEAQEQAAEEKARLAQEAQDKALKEANEAKIKAEAQLEVFKQMQQTQHNQPAQQLTEEQWKDFEEKTGMTKQQLMAMDAIGKQHAEYVSKEFDSKVKRAEERASKAEERLKSFETERSSETVKKKFYLEKPALSRYESDINDFLSDYPAEMKSDPEKLKGLLVKAETFIRGKIGDRYMRGNDTKGSARFTGGSNNETNDEEDESIDVEGLPEGSKRLVERIRPSKEKVEDFKKNYDGEGVKIHSKNEWDDAESDMKNRNK